MIQDRPIFHYALLTLEALTAHGIHSGDKDATHDVVLLRDSNGLPALSGTSIAGVLRHLYEATYSATEADALFGHAYGEEGQPSWVQFTWGLAHDSLDTPVEGLHPDIGDDPVLALLSEAHPVVRQRVRLNARGAAADTGKYDVSLVPAGCRYSLFLSYWSDGSDTAEACWARLLTLLDHPAFRLGHGTRNGSGAFKPHAIHTERWDLRTPEGQKSYRERPRSRREGRTLTALQPTNIDSRLPQLVIQLQAEAGWRVGGGDDALGLAQEKTPDMLPVSEARIVWTNGHGRVSRRQALLPATAIKGALSHRVAYHYRCLTSDWVGQDQTPRDPSDCPAVQALFGHAKDEEQSGVAGRILIDDMALEDVTIYSQMHNRIDRFTGGVMSGALFEEALLWQTPIRLSLTVLDSAAHPTIPSLARQALARTLDDLSTGWLPIGAGGGRGQGVFTSEAGPEWNDNGAWLQATEQGGASE